MNSRYWTSPRSVRPVSSWTSCAGDALSAGGFAVVPLPICDVTMPFARIAAPSGPPTSTAYVASRPCAVNLSSAPSCPSHVAITNEAMAAATV